MDQIRKWRRRVVFKQSNLSEKNCPRRDDNGILPKQYNIGRIFNAREDIDKNTKVNGANPTFDFESLKFGHLTMFILLQKLTDLCMS